MTLSVTVKPNARKESIELITANTFIVRVNAPPHDGKANGRMRKLLATYLGIAPSSLVIRTGHSSKIKIIETV